MGPSGGPSELFRSSFRHQTKDRLARNIRVAMRNKRCPPLEDSLTGPFEGPLKEPLKGSLQGSLSVVTRLNCLLFIVFGGTNSTHVTFSTHNGGGGTTRNIRVAAA